MPYPTTNWLVPARQPRWGRAEAWMPYIFALLAGACESTGQIEEGLTLSDKALEIVKMTGVRWFAAELYRHKGRLLLRQGHARPLYGRLLRAVLAQHREREARLMTGDAVSASIAHEIRQPLSAMITNANAGVRWLDRAAPDLDEAKAALKKVVTDGHRADAVIENVRALFKKDARTWTSLDVNNLIRETLALVRDDLQTYRIVVQADWNERSPRIKGDQIQLQQVLLNLFTNAIDAMATNDGERVLCVT